MTIIQYVPLTVNATGLGAPLYYNADGSQDIVAVTNVFNGWKTSFVYGTLQIYSAQLIWTPSVSDYERGYFDPIIASFRQDYSVVEPYILAWKMQQPPISYGPIP